MYNKKKKKTTDREKCYLFRHSIWNLDFRVLLFRKQRENKYLKKH